MMATSYQHFSAQLVISKRRDHKADMPVLQFVGSLPFGVLFPFLISFIFNILLYPKHRFANYVKKQLKML